MCYNVNMGKKRRSYPKSANVHYKFDITDNFIVKVKWKSPIDKKDNTLNINADIKEVNFIKIKDNH